MPNKPTTLRESLRKEFKDRFWLHRVPSNTKQSEDILDWVLEKFSTHSTELLSKIEGLRHKWTRTDSMKEIYRAGYNQALDQVISLINQEK